MNNNIAALYRLIHTLSSAEKRTFQLNHSVFKRKGNHNYLRLFSLINKEKNYNKEKFKEILKQSDIKNPRIIAHHLFNLILRTLRSTSEKTMYEGKVLNYLLEADILYHKGLNKSCLSRTDKALKTAKKANNYVLTELSLQYKIKYHRKLRHLSSAKKWKDLLKESAANRLLTNNLEAYYDIMHLVRIRVDNMTASRTDNLRYINHIINNNKLLFHEKYALSDHAKIIFYHVYTLFHLLSGDAEKAYVHFHKIALIVLKSSHFKQDLLFYINTLSNYAYTAILSGHTKKAFEVFDHLSHIKANSLMERYAKFKALYVNKLDLFSNMSYRRELPRLLHQIELELSSLPNIPNTIGYVFFYKIAMAYFHLNEYDKCIIWLNKLFQELGKEKRRDVYIGGKLLYLLAQWELQNFKLVEQNSISIQAYIKKQRALYPFEKELLKFLSKTDNNWRDTKSRLNILLQVFRVDNTNTEIKKALAHFKYDDWIIKVLKRY